MTDEKETTTEASSSDYLEQDASLEQAIADSISELGGNEAKTDEPVEGVEGPAKSARDYDLTASEAASILAKSKNKGPKRRTVEIAKVDGAPTAVEKTPLETKVEVPTGEGVKLDAPAQWNAADKEWFAKQPPEIQRNATKWFKDAQSNATRIAQDLMRRAKPYEEIERLTQAYLPQWGREGITPTQGIVQAVSMYHTLMTNPLEHVKTIMAASGLTPAHLTGQPAQQAAPQQQNNQLTAEQVQSMIAASLGQTQTQQEVYQARAEVDQVARLQDAAGRHLYPELHDPQTKLGLTDLVEAARRREPGISWGEATKRAIHTQRLLTGNPGPVAQAANRLTPQPNELEKVKGAAVSIRPRGNGNIPTTSADKPGTSLEDSLLKAIESLNTQH